MLDRDQAEGGESQVSISCLLCLSIPGQSQVISHKQRRRLFGILSCMSSNTLLDD